MKYLEYLNDEILKEMLDVYIERYKQLKKAGLLRSPVIENCRDMFIEIRKEIRKRKQNGNTSTHNKP